MLFYSSERLLGTERALLVAPLAMVPTVGRYVVLLLDVWRSSHFVGQELLSGDPLCHPESQLCCWTVSIQSASQTLNQCLCAVQIT